jgi:hypothetical protein
MPPNVANWFFANALGPYGLTAFLLIFVGILWLRNETAVKQIRKDLEHCEKQHESSQVRIETLIEKAAKLEGMASLLTSLPCSKGTPS